MKSVTTNDSVHKATLSLVQMGGQLLRPFMGEDAAAAMSRQKFELEVAHRIIVLCEPPDKIRQSIGWSIEDWMRLNSRPDFAELIEHHERMRSLISLSHVTPALVNTITDSGEHRERMEAAKLLIQLAGKKDIFRSVKVIQSKGEGEGEGNSHLAALEVMRSLKKLQSGK